MVKKIISKIKSKIKSAITIEKVLVQVEKNEAFSAGHYYSVIPSLDEVKTKAEKLFSKNDNLLGINLNLEQQLKVLESFESISNEKKFNSTKIGRFNIENDSFSYDDAPILHYFLRKNPPKRIIEIGCGNSSAVMMDTNEFYLNQQIQNLTFIDLSLKNLKLHFSEADLQKVTLIEQAVQNVGLSVYEQLEEGDLLFIDSSHVSKIGSDLNHIIFNILPVLKDGVFIHFHDIRFPFEYSKELIFNKVYWNEAYLLRAFLMFNSNYHIYFWLNCLLNQNSNSQELFNFLPLAGWDKRFNKESGDYRGAGGSIYLRKGKDLNM